MKIGIVSFHRCHNYGAVLQAYAFQNVLRRASDGIQTEYIDLDDKIIDIFGKRAGSMLYSPYSDHNLKKKIGSLRYKKELSIRWNKFECFMDSFLNCSVKIREYDDLYINEWDYDLIAAGSDQIWNSKIPVSRDYCFLNFIKGIPKIAYGSSMGDSCRLNYNQITWLRTFSNIYIRENQQVSYLNKVLNRKDVTNVLDPTLLMTGNDWKETYFKNASQIHDKYIFAYVFEKNPKDFMKSMNLIEETAKHFNCRIIMVNNTIPFHSKWIETRIEAGPIEWCELLGKASAVITNSYHGMLFSINFNKQYWLLDYDNRKSAVETQLAIKDRMLDGNNFSKPIDFDEVNKRLIQQRERSIRLLKKAIRV